MAMALQFKHQRLATGQFKCRVDDDALRVVAFPMPSKVASLLVSWRNWAFPVIERQHLPHHLETIVYCHASSKFGLFHHTIARKRLIQFPSLRVHIPMSSITADPNSMAADHSTLRGVLVAFASYAVFAFSDASIKILHGTLPAYQVAFIGSLFGFAAIPFLKARGDIWLDVVKTRNRPLWMLRFACGAISAICSIVAFTKLPMAKLSRCCSCCRRS